MINNILDFSKIEADKLGVECIDFTLNDILDQKLGLKKGAPLPLPPDDPWSRFDPDI